jgi:predicted membrane protein
MNPSRYLPSFITAAVLSAMLLTVARADNAETASIKFSDPSQPGTLKVTIANGDIRIRGSDAAEVTVRTELKNENQEQRKDGLRVLTTSSSYKLTEKNNVVSLSYGTGAWPGSGGDFDITVPRNSNVIVSSAFGGDIEVGEVSGDLEVKSLNGEVTLSKVSGGVLVETMNGEIEAEVVAMKDNKPLSFTSMNGEVSLRLPVDAKANVQMRTHNGSILTDFDETQLVTKTASLKNVSEKVGSHEMGASVSADVRVTAREAAKMGRDAAREASRQVNEALRQANRAAEDGDEKEHHEIPVPPMPPLPPMTGGKIVSGTLNGGGPEIRITTMNGEVTLRKIEPAK